MRLRRSHVYRALVIGVLFVLAYGVGAWLGSFTVAGLSLEPRFPVPDSLGSALADSAGRPATPAPLLQPTIVERGEQPHVCQGCDLGLNRDKEYLALMRLYGETPEEGAATAPEGSAPSARRILSDTDHADGRPPPVPRLPSVPLDRTAQ